MKIYIFFIPLLFIIWKYLKLSLFELMIVTLPIMFYSPLGNTSISDFFLVIYLSSGLFYKKKNKLSSSYFKEYRLLFYYGFILIIVISISLIPYLASGNMVHFNNIMEIIKILITFIYALEFFKYFANKNFNLNRFVKIWTLATRLFCIISLCGIVLYNRLGFDIGLTYANRATGTFKDPNLAAAYLILSFSLVMISDKSKSIFIKLSDVALIITVIIFTASRGACLALIISFIFVCILGLTKLDFKLILVMLIACSIFITIKPIISQNEFFKVYADRLEKANFNDESLGTRKYLWDLGISMGKENPILGVGIGEYTETAKKISRDDTIFSISHNTYICFFSETGIAGLISFIWFPIICIILMLINIIKNKNIYNNYMLVFSTIAFFILAYTLNLQNFRVLWIFLSFIFIQNKCVNNNNNEVSLNGNRLWKSQYHSCNV